MRGRWSKLIVERTVQPEWIAEAVCCHVLGIPRNPSLYHYTNRYREAMQARARADADRFIAAGYDPSADLDQIWWDTAAVCTKLTGHHKLWLEMELTSRERTLAMFDAADFFLDRHDPELVRVDEFRRKMQKPLR